MNAPLYNAEILRLAASIPFDERLAAPDASVERRSPVCGSRVTVDLRLAEGRVTEVAVRVQACALGQASAALLRMHVAGRDASDLAATRDALAGWLAGEGAMPDWPGIAIFERALPHRGRHAAIMLPFAAAAEAAGAR